MAQVKNERGKEGVRAQIVAAKRPGVWTAGPLADAFGRSMLTHHGDSIVVKSPRKKQPYKHDTLGLDAKGRWSPAGSPDSWLSSTRTDSSVRIDAPSERPGFPKPSSSSSASRARSRSLSENDVL